MAGSEVIISMEELHEMRKVIQVKATSGSTISRQERFDSIRKAKHNNTSRPQTPKTRIQKVPSVMRHIILQDTKDGGKYFEPMMVSIGPYHHGTDKLAPGEELKRKLTQQFFSDHEKLIEVLYEKILQEIQNLRDCYDVESTTKYDDEALAWMLFVDGCSVLSYIHLCVESGEPDEYKLKNHEIAFVRQDLFLLENQLPFQVLEFLMSEEVIQFKEGMEMIKKFILMIVTTPERRGWRQQWRKRWQQCQQLCQQLRQKCWKQQQQQDNLELPTEEKPSHLLELLRKTLIGEPEGSGADTGKKENDWQSFRDVTELRAAGIHLKRSKTHFLLDVSFTPRFIFGYLRLPPIVVDDSTKAKFLNLIAYEMCPDFDNKFEVTSYICFLDSLIDQADDVKKLRKKCILHNFLGSDEEVAKLFNEIATDLVPSPDIYRHVKAGIQKHYDDIGKAWIAEFVHSHLSSPWTVIAFIAAVTAFALSIVPYVHKDQK
ncbi:hypothetical protein L1049_009187 [Liquidambar formosana]|uniref:Uncharacterized protein n=1 Tax=Liquidambar formosana TaxID=63359 RepID=A0AAP0SBU7_LIQFO